ncbi:hypothetical protein AHF37_11138 [Paragonimus kellicotti]|nr:hypothetical protein AHF37_11138 [Paragonimus kellicotti]
MSHPAYTRYVQPSFVKVFLLSISGGNDIMDRNPIRLVSNRRYIIQLIVTKYKPL